MGATLNGPNESLDRWADRIAKRAANMREAAKERMEEEARYERRASVRGRQLTGEE